MKTRCSVTAYDAKWRATSVSRTTLNGEVETSKFNYTYTGDVASTVHHVVVSGNKGFSAVTTNGYDTKSGKLSSTTEAVSYYGTSASATVAKYGYDGLGRLLQVMRSGRAGASSYTYDLHGWPTGVKSKAFEEELFYTDGCGEPRYSGSISSVEWKNPNYPKLRGYMYYYDRLGRLESAVYGEGAGLTTNPNRYNETVLEYTANGAIERFQRRGLKQDGQYGKIDNLNITLDGNRVVGVEDDAAPLLYKGALDFTDNTGGGTEYTYDGDGRLTGDRNRGIAKIEYDAAGNPRRVQYMDGSVTEYVYTAAGEKLRAIHRTAAPNVSVAFGQTKELTASETLSVDSTDYFGKLTAENGEAKIYNFGGGYCTFDGACKFHYFDRDHQGNVRAVVSTAGTIEQIMNYYPFGAPYCDNTTLNPDLQPYKYNGKEFETMHGRNAYDYGARFYDPLLPTWDRIDPLCETNFNISPYAYCKNNPINMIDLFGLKDYDSEDLENVWNDFDVNNDRVNLPNVTVVYHTFAGAMGFTMDFMSSTGEIMKVPKEVDAMFPNSFKSKTLWDAKQGFTNAFPQYKPQFSRFHPSEYYTKMTARLNKVAKLGNKIGTITMAVEVGEIAFTGEVKASNLLGVAVPVVASLAGPYSWAIMGGYALIDLGVIFTTGESIGTHLDNYVNDNTDFKNGVLIHFH